MSETRIGPGTMLEVIAAAIESGAKFGDVLTLTDSDGNAQTIEIGDRIVLPPSAPLFSPLV